MYNPGLSLFKHAKYQTFSQAEEELIKHLKSKERHWWKAKYPGYDPIGEAASLAQ